MLNYRDSTNSAPFQNLFTDSFSDTKFNLIKTIVLVNSIFLALIYFRKGEGEEEEGWRWHKDNRIKTVYKLLLCHIGEITDKWIQRRACRLIVCVQ